MNRLPDRSNLDHLKKQAKDLIRSYRNRDPQAIASSVSRCRPPRAAATTRSLRSSCGCMTRNRAWRAATVLHPGRTCGRMSKPMRARAPIVRRARGAGSRWCIAARSAAASIAPVRASPCVCVENPDLVAGDPYVACAIGDEGALQAATAADPTWVNRAGGPLRLPALLAVTHSTLLQVPEFRERLLGSARYLLAAGADPNHRIGLRWPPASLREPDDDHPLSALYGAAGLNHDPELTKLLLEAGADSNDGESLYHSLENLACTRALLEHGARIEENNALYRALDFDNVAVLELLLAHGADANVSAGGPPISDWGTPLLWAIYRRRSRRHVEALLAAGASPLATTPGGVDAYSLALQFGLRDVAAVLRDHGAGAALSEDQQFVAACAAGDEAEARRVRARRPDLPRSLPKAQLRLLPDMVAAGGDEGAKLMVKLGWPITARGGDWNASALNLAVFLGNAPMTRFLLEHGASWTEVHGYGDNVCGSCRGRRATSRRRAAIGPAAPRRCWSTGCRAPRPIPTTQTGF
jgi:hypothetical protein